MNKRHFDPPGVYARDLARYLGVKPSKVEAVCEKLGIERYTLGQFGRPGPLVPFSVDQVVRILARFRQTEGKKLLGRHGLRKAS